MNVEVQLSTNVTRVWLGARIFLATTLAHADSDTKEMASIAQVTIKASFLTMILSTGLE